MERKVKLISAEPVNAPALPPQEKATPISQGKRKEILEKAQSANAPECVHHWMVGEPYDGKASGDCIKCGGHKVFEGATFKAPFGGMSRAFEEDRLPYY